MTVVTRGDREVSARFETFPARARAKLEQRIRALTNELETRVRSTAPFKDGFLRSEITQRVYAENQNRVAGYVQVYAPERGSNEYAKAATLEYGSNKPRKYRDKRGKIAGLLARSLNLRIQQRISKAPHIAARRYLRGPLEQMRPEIEASIEAAMAEAAAEGDG